MVQPPEYRVDELARAAGTSVRNVRVYQDRGLLDPPRRQGRVGYYSEDHLDRLRLIGRLLDRGYTFATIAELLTAWRSGAGLSRVLGLTDAIGGPWSDEAPGRVTLADLRRRFSGDDAAGFVSRAVALGVLEPDGAGFRVPSPHLLDAGAALVAAGIPLPVVLDLTVALREQLDGVADLLFTAVAGHLPGLAELQADTPDDVLDLEDLEDLDDERPADPDGARGGHRHDHEGHDHEGHDHAAHVSEVVSRLRPHGLRAVEAMFALAMRERAEQAVAELTHAEQGGNLLTG